MNYMRQRSVVVSSFDSRRFPPPTPHVSSESIGMCDIGGLITTPVSRGVVIVSPGWNEGLSPNSRKLPQAWRIENDIHTGICS